MGEISINPKFNIHETYKKVRILNPYRNSGVPVSGIDPDYQAKLDYAAGNFIPLPSEAQSAIYNQKIIDLKTTDIWEKSAVILDFSGDADIAFKTLCIKRRVECVSYGNPTWSNEGWKGNGTNAYIDPLYHTNDTADWQLNNAGVSWDNFFKSPNNGAIVAAYSGGTSDYTFIIGGGRYNINGSTTITPAWSILGFNSANRISATEVLANGVVRLQNSNTKLQNKLYIGARNRVDQGGSADSFTEEGIGFVFIGGASQDYNRVKAIFDTY